LKSSSAFSSRIDEISWIDFTTGLTEGVESGTAVLVGGGDSWGASEGRLEEEESGTVGEEDSWETSEGLLRLG